MTGTARLLISIMTVIVMATVAAVPARSALIYLAPSTEARSAGHDPMSVMMAGAVDFRTLSAAMPIMFDYGAQTDTATEAFASNSGGTTWPPNSFQRVEDPVILPDLPPSAGWVPLVGGLALVAYRMRRTDRRFRFRSAV